LLVDVTTKMLATNFPGLLNRSVALSEQADAGGVRRKVNPGSGRAHALALHRAFAAGRGGRRAERLRPGTDLGALADSSCLVAVLASNTVETQAKCLSGLQTGGLSSVSQLLAFANGAAVRHACPPDTPKPSLLREHICLSFVSYSS
jgi:hypothetical protein